MNKIACFADIFNGWWSSQFLVVVPVNCIWKLPKQNKIKPIQKTSKHSKRINEEHSQLKPRLESNLYIFLALISSYIVYFKLSCICYVNLIIYLLSKFDKIKIYFQNQLNSRFFFSKTFLTFGFLFYFTFSVLLRFWWFRCAICWDLL